MGGVGSRLEVYRELCGFGMSGHGLRVRASRDCALHELLTAAFKGRPGLKKDENEFQAHMKRGMSCHGRAPVSISARTGSTSGRASNKLTPNCIEWGEQCARVEVRTKRAYLAAPRPKLLGRLDLLVSLALCRAATTILCRLGSDVVRPGMSDGADVRGREEDGAVAPLAPPNVFLLDDTRQASVHREAESGGGGKGKQAGVCCVSLEGNVS